MRLIDADDLIKGLEKFESETNKNEIRCFSFENVKELLKNTPTAYDIEEKIKSEMSQEVLQALTFTIVKEEEIPKDTITTNTILQALKNAIEALEKQTPLKIIIKKRDCDVRIGRMIFKKGTRTYYCPKCNNLLALHHTYCPTCGQKLDRSEILGETTENRIDSRNQI